MTRLEINRCLVCKCRGDCCYFSNVIDGKHHIILDKHPCEFLNVITGLCTQYINRKELFKNCVSIEVARVQGALPVGCLYIKKDVTPKVPYKRRINYEKDNIRIQKRYEYLNNLSYYEIKKGIQDEAEEYFVEKLKEENTT